MNRPIIVWFRHDLRLADHPALCAAMDSGRPVLAVYVRDRDAADRWTPGGASNWWLHHSLSALASRLSERGAELVLRTGAAEQVLAELADQVDAGQLVFSRAYTPWGAAQEQRVHDALSAELAIRRFPGTLLFEPESIATGSGSPYKVFTPFWKSCRAAVPPGQPRAAPETIPAGPSVPTESLADWQLLPSKPDWADGLRENWSPGERGAQHNLERFIDQALDAYANDRNRPDRHGTSRLSAHLAFGEISPRQVWHRIRNAVVGEERSESACWSYLRELGWREFSAHLLFHWPHLPERAFRPEYDQFPWREDDQALRAWERGMTGFPIVDAGMRELWHSGWMHNRVRMIVGSFLVKDLLLNWQHGERWFWDTLVDADLANNAAGWQWIAGSGADAAPYFRIFNPILQGKKFDPKGDYIRRWIPELAKLPNAHLNEPWSAPAEVLEAAGVRIGDTYPAPIVDRGEARQRALDAWQTVRK